MNYNDYVNARIAQGVTLDIGKAIGDGFRYFGKKAGYYIGYLLLLIVISIFASLLSGIHFAVGILVSAFVTAPLTVGFGLYAHAHKLNSDAPFEVFFSGFKRNYINLALVNLLLQIVSAVVMLILLKPYIGDFTAMMQSAQGDPEAMMDIFREISVSIQNNIWVIGGAMLFLILVNVVYSQASYVAVIHGYSFWESLEVSRRLVAKAIFPLIGLYFVVGILLTIGTVVTLMIGLIVLAPVFMLIMFSAFEQIVGLPVTERALEDEFHID